jgi:SAM-dependent methyltransferase
MTVRHNGNMTDVPMVVHDPALAKTGTHPKYPTWKDVPPLPDPSLLHTVGAGSLENFYLAGEAVAHLLHRRLRQGGTTLDMGCGCGRTARFLLFRDDIRYVGFDIFRPAIDWSNTYLAPLGGGRFHFHHVDAHSAHYNPFGALKASEIRFPASDGSIDLAFAASLFTHLLEPDAAHYLAESARCLAPSGLLVASIHHEPQGGQSYSGRENRIDVEKTYFIGMARTVGLEMSEDLGTVCGQELLVFRKIG